MSPKVANRPHTRWPAFAACGTILAVVTCASWLSYRGGVEGLEGEARKQLAWEVTTAGAATEGALGGVISTLELWLQQPLMLRILDQDPDAEIALLLRGSLARLPQVRDLACMDSRGTVVAATQAAHVGAAELDAATLERLRSGARAIVDLDRGDLRVLVPVYWRFDEPEMIGALEARSPPAAYLVDDRPTCSGLRDAHAQAIGLRSLAASPTDPLGDPSLVLQEQPLRWPTGVQGPPLTFFLAEPRARVAAPLLVLRRIGLWLTAGTTLAVLGIVAIFVRGERALGHKLAERARDLERSNTDLTRSQEALRRETDRAEASSRAKGEFLANMSHEIRTPMNGVIGMTELLADTPLNPEQQDYVETIKKSGQALMTIIDDVLDFSKIEAGKLTIESVEFDPRSEIEEAVEIVGERASTKGLELSCVLPADLPQLVRGDPTRVRQVLLNLVSNAVKFTERGGVVVRVSVAECAAHSVLLRFEVQDSGIGIAPDVLPKLFQSFTQADGSMKRRFGGTGLGLAISRQLVQRMGGEIGVQSELGRGSTFHFTLRLEVREAAATHKTPGLASLSVLYVDDNEVAREVVERNLTHQVRRFTGVESAKRALAVVREAARAGTPFDVVLIDLCMPDVDGCELARTLRADACTSSLDLVLITAYRQHVPAEARVLCRTVLHKPLRRSALFRVLQEAQANAVLGGLLPPLPEPSEPARRFEGRILLAEDNTINQAVARRSLETLGLTVEVAADGHEALDALARSRFDVVFMDGQMPELDGYAATRMLREREAASGAPRTVVIAMTAHAMQGDRERCLAAGMDDYLSKPVHKQALIAKLRRWLSDSQASVGARTPSS